MALSGNVLARCLLLIAMTAYSRAQNATAPVAAPVAAQPNIYPYGYPVQPYPMQPYLMPITMQHPVQPVQMQPAAVQPVQPVQPVATQPVANATWPAYPYAYYPYQQPANTYSQLMNIFPNQSQTAQPQYYYVPIANQTTTPSPSATTANV